MDVCDCSTSGAVLASMMPTRMTDSAARSSSRKSLVPNDNNATVLDSSGGTDPVNASTSVCTTCDTKRGNTPVGKSESGRLKSKSNSSWGVSAVAGMGVPVVLRFPRGWIRGRLLCQREGRRLWPTAP